MVLGLFLMAIGCSKNTGNSIYMGTWSGSYRSTVTATYPPTSDTGTLQISVDANNSATCILQSLPSGMLTKMMGAVVPSSGAVSLSINGMGNGLHAVNLVGLHGNLSLDSGSGTLAYPWATTSKWQVTKNQH